MVFQDLFIKNRFSKYWVVASILDFLVHKSTHWPYYEMKTFFLWLGRMGYKIYFMTCGEIIEDPFEIFKEEKGQWIFLKNLKNGVTINTSKNSFF